MLPDGPNRPHNIPHYTQPHPRYTRRTPHQESSLESSCVPWGM